MALNYGLIGHRVRTLRKMQKMSQAVLAEHTGLSVPYISHIETGIKHVSLESIVKIADALGCTVDQLLYENQRNDRSAYLIEFAEILSDYSLAERRMLLDLLIAIRNCMSRSGYLRQYNSRKER